MYLRLLFPFFLVSLLTGIIGGLYRIGWNVHIPHTAAYHGLLMVGGFLGGVITFERMITMKNKWWLLFPVFCALGITGGLFGSAELMIICQTIAAIGLVMFYFHHASKDKGHYWYIMALGAFCWIIGNLHFLKSDIIPFAVPWWIGFILFTILGERLELARFLPVSTAKLRYLYVLLFVFLLSLWLPLHGLGKWLYSLSLLGVIHWFVNNDMARKSIKMARYPRFLGTGILTSYGWLFLHLVAILFFLEHSQGYDLYIHTFFLGFAFSMIWAHAPMLMPTVIKVRGRSFHPMIWFFWAFFQLTLLGRVAAVFHTEAKKVAALANGVSIVLLFLVIAYLTMRLKRKTQVI